ncbi:MAG: cyclase family protein [Proteobacteria bacterium]|nr:cyclase family protein [Pseudomonadota bacterium]
MILNLKFNDLTYQVDTQDAISITIPLKFNAEQPNHFGAEVASKQALQADGFIGDTKRGGSCNVDSITLVPHCNGTHTESIAHIVHQEVSIGQNISNALTICQLISVTPIAADNTYDSYLPELNNNDLVIDLASLKSQLSDEKLVNIEALIIRTLPNTNNKLSCIYSQKNQPPFFTHEVMSWLAASGIKHLLVDMPSIDKMYDDGQLSNHHIYWQVEPNSRLLNDDSKIDRTITEMIYVDNSIEDGLYCLNLQIPAFELDAAPSRPIIYPLTQIQI